MKKKITITFVVFVGIISVWFYFFHKVNKKIPQAQRIEVCENESMLIDDIEFQVNTTKIYDYEELIRAYEKAGNLEWYQRYNEEYGLSFIFAEMTMKNIGSEDKTVNAYDFVIGTLTGSNGMSMDLFEIANDSIELMSPTIKSGEEVTVILTFSYVNGYINGDLYKKGKMEDEEFELILSLYPVRRSIHLNVYE